MSIENENELEFTEDENQSEETVTETPSEESVDTEYTPNLSYSVRDEEFQFDERFKDVVKSKDDEEYIRDLYTRSAGLDTYKNKYGELESQTNSLIQGFNTLKGFRDSKDMRSLMKALNVDEETLLDYTEELLKEHELPEEQRQLIERNRQLEERVNGFESKLSGFQEQEVNRRVDDDLNELRSLVSNDIYNPVANAMQSVGLDMAQEVLSAGHMEFSRTGKEPTVASVVKAVADKFNYLTKNQTSNKPVLPTVNSTGSSHVASKVKSIDDIRAALKAMS
jgi:hypothetical protein